MARSTDPPARPLRLEFKSDAAGAKAEAAVRERVERAFGHWAPLITRVIVREDDLNGPRGGVDRRCSIEVRPVSLDPVRHEARAANRNAALARAVAGIERVLRRLFERHGFRAGRRSVSQPPRAAIDSTTSSLVGRREGRSALRQGLARARPEKQVRDLWVDTAAPGASASDRLSGDGHTARRNARKQRNAMTVLLEDSTSGKPSRKSTRRSSNRGKPSQGKERTAVARSTTPSARNRRGR